MVSSGMKYILLLAQNTTNPAAPGPKNKLRHRTVQGRLFQAWVSGKLPEQTSEGVGGSRVPEFFPGDEGTGAGRTRGAPLGPLGGEAGSRPPARGSLLEVGQVEELEAPVALDRAVDEDHVVDCGAGPVSAEGPPRARPRPAPPRSPFAPPGTNNRKPGTKKMALETPAGGGAESRLGGTGRDSGVTARASLSAVEGAVSCQEGGSKLPRGLGARGSRRSSSLEGTPAACGGRRGRSPGEGATSSPTAIRISTAHRWSREGECVRRGRALGAGRGPPPTNPIKA